MLTAPFARRLSLAVTAALLLGACADAPTVPAAASAALDVAGENGAFRYTADELYDFGGDSYTQFTCEDGTQSEQVQLFGQIFERYTFMMTPSGRIQYVSSTMPVGMYGVGLTSGQRYRVVEREQMTQHYDENDKGGGSMRETLLLRAEETHETFGITYLVQWRSAGTGEITVNRWKELETCR